MTKLREEYGQLVAGRSHPAVRRRFLAPMEPRLVGSLFSEKKESPFLVTFNTML